MAVNKRENERRKRKEEKNKKRNKTLWILIVIAVAVIVIMKVSEVNFTGLLGGVKNQTGISEKVSDEAFPYKLDSGENTILSVMGSKLSILNDSSYSVINSSNAQELIKDNHSYANPVIKVSGGYSVIIDQGSNVYRLDSSSENIYENSVDDKILCADVSDTGVIALATVSGIQKSTVTAYSKSLNQKMSYEVSGGYITSLAIDDRGRNIAFTVLSSDNAKIKSTIYTMSVNDPQPRAEFTYTNSSVLDLHFVSNNVYVVGTDFVSVISSLTKEVKVYEQGSINTVSYCFNPADNLVLAFNDYTGAASSKIAYIQQNGKIKTQLDVNAEVKDITASGTEMTILTSSEVISYKISTGKEKSRTAVDDSYTDIQQVSSKVFGKHLSYLELIND
ncbi:MAG: hypothetical protein K2G22_06860 [Eubacterium sp.]|nr:hypothetical protein [Eubacterium sp.]